MSSMIRRLCYILKSQEIAVNVGKRHELRGGHVLRQSHTLSCAILLLISGYLEVPNQVSVAGKMGTSKRR